MGEIVLTEDAQPLAEVFRKMYEEKKFANVIFVVDGGERFHAHRLVLASRSEYFEKLLFGDFLEAKQDEVPLSVPAQPFSWILEYMYSDRLRLPRAELTVELILQVLRLLHEFQFSSMVAKVACLLTERITMANLYTLQEAANLYDLTDLAEACDIFRSEHALDLLQAPEFLELPEDKVMTLIKSDHCFAPESEIFKAVLAWKEANPTERLEAILENVRFSLMDSDFLLRSVADTGLLEPTKFINILKAIHFGVGRENRRKLQSTKSANQFQDLMFAKRADCVEIFSTNCIKHDLKSGKALIDLGEEYTFNYIRCSIEKNHKYSQLLIYHSVDSVDWIDLGLISLLSFTSYDITFPAVTARYLRFHHIYDKLLLKNVELLNAPEFVPCNVALEKYGATLLTNGDPISNHKLLSEDADVPGGMSYTSVDHRGLSIEFGREYFISEIRIKLNTPTTTAITLDSGSLLGRHHITDETNTFVSQSDILKVLTLNGFRSIISICGYIEVKTIECISNGPLNQI